MSITSPIYTPLSQSSPTLALRQAVNCQHRLNLSSYQDLYNWSCSDIHLFWNSVWDSHPPILGYKPQGATVVDTHAHPADNPAWFPGSSLNWAENMLRHSPSNHHTALIQLKEPFSFQNGPSALPPTTMTYSRLYILVADLVSALLAIPILPGDRVASYASNSIENVAALLATTAIGAIWVAAASDFGPDGVLERLEQVQPKVLFVIDSVSYNGSIHYHIPKVSKLLDGLASRGILPTKTIVIESGLTPQTNTFAEIEQYNPINWVDFVQYGNSKKLGRTNTGEIEWMRFPFDWPIWILFSSGTTGKPKPIVHRAGGMLLQSKKELLICGDLQPSDVFFYYTTTGWMMYNWLVAGLQVGCTLVLYDGSPLKDPSLLWKWVDDLNITLFGTSAKYLDALSRIYKPKDHHQLTSLRHIYSTGSPLSAKLFDFVYQHINSNVLLGSITGGTDICSLFAGMNTSLPVYRGEIQCRMLGMAIEAYLPDGKVAAPGEPGELVCTRPFPCQPLGFWPLKGYGNDTDVEKAEERYRQAYFSEFKNVWYHGDHVIITESRENNGGGVVMLGRSDGVLNPGGVRFGTAEIYDVIELCFSESNAVKPEHTVKDCIAVGQSIQDGTDERVILFVVLPDGQKMSLELDNLIKSEIRSRRSPRHVPSKIIQVQDIPQTLNGKRVEVPIKRIINGAPITSINPATLKNPQCLEDYARIGDILRQETIA